MYCSERVKASLVLTLWTLLLYVRKAGMLHVRCQDRAYVKLEHSILQDKLLHLLWLETMVEMQIGKCLMPISSCVRALLVVVRVAARLEGAGLH